MPRGTALPTDPTSSGARVVARAVRESWRRTREELRKVRAQKSHARVHDLRVALRRLLAALALAKAVGAAPPATLTGELERALRSLSPLRDLEVQKKALVKLAEHTPALAELAARLERKRASLAKRLVKRLGEFAVHSTDQAVERCALALDNLPGLSRVPTLLALGAVAQSYAKFDRRRRAVAATDGRELHRVRVACKQYRYAVELVLPLLPAGTKDRLVAMKDFQDELGALQDATVLLRTLRRAKLSGPRGRAVAAGAARALDLGLRRRREATLAALAAQVAVEPPLFSEIFG